MSLPSIETARLFLRVYNPEDLDARHAIRNDPDVYRYFPPYYSPPTKEKAREGIAGSIRGWREKGFGEFAVLEKISGELIGYCGLMSLDKSEEIEIYYGFPKKYWGKGFATEAARAVLKFAFDEAKLSQVVGVTNPKNIASQKVLQKIGLKYQGQITCYQMDCAYFRISREEFYK
jgi:RimJ/RimL family protein N-acetyltransferase